VLRFLLLLALLLSRFGFACEGEYDVKSACQEFWDVSVPDDQEYAAPNVRLIRFQYMNPNESVRNVSPDELVRLHAAVRPLAAAAFSSSKSEFEVTIRFTLYQDKPATLDMRTNAGEPEVQMLTEYLLETSMLTEFHSTKGVSWVLLSYAVIPPYPAMLGDDYEEFELRAFPWRSGPGWLSYHGG